jgi:hypothetical protein
MKRGAGCDLLALILLFSLGSALFLTNRWFSVIDDEAYQVGSAAQPFGVVANQFRTSDAQLHPPLPDIILHFWLRLTRNSLLLLRVPSTLFFVLGIWVCSLSAKKEAGESAAKATLVLGVLWPYGFHFGRYAVWLSFCFFLLACLLYVYLCWFEQPIISRLCALLAIAVAVLYTNYMGWAFLFVLALDFFFRRELHSRRHRQQLVILGAILVLCYLLLWSELFQLLRYRNHALSANSFLVFLYSFYVLIASESIAPWVLVLSVPLFIAIAVCSLLILFRGPRLARMLYGCTLLLGVALALSGEMNQKRVLPLGAWMLTAAGISIATESPRWRRLLVTGFVVVGVVSWSGSLQRKAVGIVGSPDVVSIIVHRYVVRD